MSCANCCSNHWIKFCTRTIWNFLWIWIMMTKIWCEVGRNSGFTMWCDYKKKCSVTASGDMWSGAPRIYMNVLCYVSSHHNTNTVDFLQNGHCRHTIAHREDSVMAVSCVHETWNAFENVVSKMSSGFNVLPNIRERIYLHELTLIPSWISNHVQVKCRIKLLFHSQTSTAAPLKFWDG